ncbi:MAG TPA: SDR family oxidoreductase, partial [Iamia sp.]|nr:SDR family oxidoreductase [Iamia sp.]
VVIFDLQPPPAAAAIDAWERVDVTDWEAVSDAVDRIVNRTGAIDVVIANAGISVRRPFLEMSAKDVQSVIDVNLLGVMALWQAAARHMVRARRGVLLATASTNGSAGYPRYADYNATKAAVLALSRTLALELAPHVRTACVSPGYVLTPMQRTEYSDAQLDALNRRIPARRHANPDEVAAAFAYLASAEASYITGQEIVIDGGELAGSTAADHGIAFPDPTEDP